MREFSSPLTRGQARQDHNRGRWFAPLEYRLGRLRFATSPQGGSPHLLSFTDETPAAAVTRRRVNVLFIEFLRRNICSSEAVKAQTPIPSRNVRDRPCAPQKS